MRKRLTNPTTKVSSSDALDELRHSVVIPVRPSSIARRKSEHIDIVLSGKAAAHTRTTGFEDIHFEHCALPELNLDEICLEVEFLGRTMAAPFLISSMTGGPEAAERINCTIAEAAQAARVAFAVGSQRIALEGSGDFGFGPNLRRLAPDVPILANFGAVQLKQWDGPTMMRRAVDMIEADALILHINALQEAVQTGGDRDWSQLLRLIGSLASDVDVPIMVKEVGAGISGGVARQLWEAGVRIIDVAGAGGTSWAAVEAQRARSERRRRIGEAFRDWGVPTATAVRDVRARCPGATIIASGGIRDGVEGAKAIRIGADIVAQAAGVLQAALDGPDRLLEHIQIFTEQLRVACFCTGSANIERLKHAPLLA